MDRYSILAHLHEILEPRGYLEIGVQTGASLQLAKNCTDAVGVDPDFSNLNPTSDVSFATLVEATSDEFFVADPSFTGLNGESFLDLVFIDGLHHSDQVWRDFWFATKLGHARTVYVFDDVLPRNQEEASRVMCPGDWTGDVWKATEAIRLLHSESLLVDTFPTGIMITFGPGVVTPPVQLSADYFRLWMSGDDHVPEDIIARTAAVQPDEALEEVRAWKVWMTGQ